VQEFKEDLRRTRSSNERAGGGVRQPLPSLRGSVAKSNQPFFPRILGWLRFARMKDKAVQPDLEMKEENVQSPPPRRPHSRSCRRGAKSLIGQRTSPTRLERSLCSNRRSARRGGLRRKLLGEIACSTSSISELAQPQSGNLSCQSGIRHTNSHFIMARSAARARSLSHEAAQRIGVANA